MEEFAIGLAVGLGAGITMGVLIGKRQYLSSEMSVEEKKTRIVLLAAGSVIFIAGLIALLIKLI